MLNVHHPGPADVAFDDKGDALTGQSVGEDPPVHRREHTARYTADLRKRSRAAGATRTIVTNIPLTVTSRADVPHALPGTSRDREPGLTWRV